MHQPQRAQPVIVLHRDELDSIEQLARAATHDEWQLGHTGTETIDAAAKWMDETIRKRDQPDLWLVFSGDPDAEGGAICPAYTGNGPTSLANAEYIVAVQPFVVRKLLFFLRHMLGDQTSIALPFTQEDFPCPKKD